MIGRADRPCICRELAQLREAADSILEQAAALRREHGPTEALIGCCIILRALAHEMNDEHEAEPSAAGYIQ